MTRRLARSYAVAAMAAMVAGISGCRDFLGIRYLTDDAEGGVETNDGSAPEASGSPDAGGDDATMTSDSTASEGAPPSFDGRAPASEGSPGEAGDAPPSKDSSVEASPSGDGGPCTNACTAGLTECASGGVQTCQMQSSGCTQWVQTVTCGAHQACSAASGAAKCTCNASPCTEAGTSCQDSQTVATCASDTDGCLYVASTATCTMAQSCSGLPPNAACSSTCSDSCTQGQASCVSGGLATCTLGSNGCRAYAAPVACGTHQTCTGAAGSAACTCNADPVCSATGSVCANTSMLATCSQDAQGCFYESGSSQCTNGACSGHACCTNACTSGATQCAVGGLQTCAMQSNGCLGWNAAVPCATHQSCTGSVGSAACTCDATTCTQTGNVCQDSQTVATCMTDAQNCLYVASTSMCTMPQSCSGVAPNAMCALTCTDSCTQGQTSCVSGGKATCTLGSNGCWAYGAPVACGTNQSCTGAAGAAMCTCNTDPVCSSVGNACANPSTLVSCLLDAQGCFYQSMPSPCTNGACSGGACCTNACTSAQCLSTSSTQIQTCSVGPNGCNVSATSACSTGLVCERYGGASCVNPNWAEWPVPNAQVDVSAGAPNLDSLTDNGDGTITDNVTGLVWQKTLTANGGSQAAASSYCAGLNLGGYTDWRLPSIIELISIGDAPFFTAIPQNIWSSTAYAGATGQAWFIQGLFTSANVVSASYYPVCVR